MNLLSLCYHEEVCLCSHLLYFLCLHILSVWTFLLLKGEKLRDKMWCVCPLNLINGYHFLDTISEGIKDISQNLVKVVEILQTSVHFGPGWKQNVSLSVPLQVILFFFRIFPYLGHLVLHTPILLLCLLLWNTTVGCVLGLWWAKPANISFISVSKTRLWL